MAGVEGDYMTGRFPDPEQLVIDRGYGFDWRRREAEGAEMPVSRPQVFDHEVERRIARCHFTLRDEDQVRASAQFKHRYIRPRVHGPHSDYAHEARGIFQPVGFKNVRLKV